MLSVATVLGGLGGVLKALSCLGPAIIVFLLATAGATALAPAVGFESGAAAVDSGALPMIQIGGGGPLAAGASYGGFVILWFAAFLAEIGAKNKLSRSMRACCYPACSSLALLRCAASLLSPMPTLCTTQTFQRWCSPIASAPPLGWPLRPWFSPVSTPAPCRCFGRVSVASPRKARRGIRPSPWRGRRRLLRRVLRALRTAAQRPLRL